MKAAEYVGRVSANGTLEIPSNVESELALRPGSQVKVILLREEDAPEEKERLRREQADVWRQVDEVRRRFAGLQFNATEAVLLARHEEEEPL